MQEQQEYWSILDDIEYELALEVKSKQNEIAEALAKDEVERETRIKNHNV